MLAVASKKAEEIDATSADLMIVLLVSLPPRHCYPLLLFGFAATQCARVTVFLHFVSFL
jgi:hypothetical protein